MYQTKLIIATHLKLELIIGLELKFKTVNEEQSMQCEELYGS